MLCKPPLNVRAIVRLAIVSHHGVDHGLVRDWTNLIILASHTDLAHVEPVRIKLARRDLPTARATARALLHSSLFVGGVGICWHVVVVAVVHIAVSVAIRRKRTACPARVQLRSQLCAIRFRCCMCARTGLAFGVRTGLQTKRAINMWHSTLSV